MQTTDVLVVGSSAAGLVAALTAKSTDPSRSVTVVRPEEKTLVPCGIPYTFGSIESTDRNILPSDKMFADAGVELVFGTVAEIQTGRRFCRLESGEEIGWKRLVLATGSAPYVPSWLPGTDKLNVFTVPKDKTYLDAMKLELQAAERVVVIGAGFIGVEISDELAQQGKQVVLMEKLPQILGAAFDADVANRAEEILKERGVTVQIEADVREIRGGDRASGVVLADGTVLDADAVVLAVGYRPRSRIAVEAGLVVDEAGFIVVDEYLRTSAEGIFAVGDCAQKTDFATRKAIPVMLASTACAEARTAGINLFKLSAVKTFSGTISIFSTALGDTGFGVAGLTETQARKESFDIVTGIFEGMDKHPGALAHTHRQFIKLVVGRESGVILGGEILGGLSTGELTNMLGFIIQNRMDVNAVLTSQIGTHPLLTASPAGYPLLKAAADAAQQIMGAAVAGVA
ncbi:MAG: FAD-dependent oxidoreductase [bacterium]|nr:FAD-dependent oxidoreductase [bacterium]